jgi:Protein of unknown function (DUF2752)
MTSPRRVALSLTMIVGIALSLLFLRAYPPQQFRFYPSCAFHQFTGLNCPGCGGMRCMNALLNGRGLDALRDNVLIVLFLPFFVFDSARRWWFWMRGLPQPPLVQMKSWVVYTIAITVISFAVLRNLPWTPFHCLAPH